MKKMVFYGILLLVTKGYTQMIPESSLEPMLINIDQTTVTSSIIYDRVSPFANLYNFNTSTELNIANFRYFKQALSEMYRASDATKFISVEQLNQNLNSLVTTPSSVTMGILNTSFQNLNYNETTPSSGRILLNTTTNLLYDSGNTSLPLFNTKHTTVISPLKDVVEGNAISFKWLSNFNFENPTNTGKKIKTLTVNYGNGTVYTIISNAVLTNSTQTITFTGSGEKTLTFVVTYVDNSTLTTYAKIRYIGMSNLTIKGTGFVANNPNCGIDYGLRGHNKESTSDYVFQGYDEAFGFKGFINYDVFYKNNNTDKIITKPIIIIDGFDPGDKRQVLPCDYKDGKYIIGESRAISDLMKYSDYSNCVDNPNTPINECEKDLIKELQSKGFDVIIVNQPTYNVMNTPPYQVVNEGTPNSRAIDGGGDYIERNGLNLVTLIKKLNAEIVANGSAEKLVIVGPSMGGQISRYALAYMEKNNIPHNTRLWISVDSPHLGANIPLGAQAELSLLTGENDEAKDFYNNLLGSAAAKQQLIEFHKSPLEWGVVRSGDKGQPAVYGWKPNYHLVDQSLLDAKTISQGFSSNSGSTFFQNFYNNQFGNGLPNSKGYPINLRKIAIANGSLTGNKIGYDSQQTVNVRGFMDICFGFCAKVHVASFEIYTLPSFGNTANISRFKSGLKGDKTTIAPNINSRGNMDILPGGYLNAYDQIHNAIMKKSGPKSYFAIPFHIDFTEKDVNLESRVNTQINSFIPTFSALGIKNPNQNWAAPLNRNLVCSGEIPFDSYYGTSENTQHTSFTLESVTWLLKELGDSTHPPVPQAPWFPVNSVINGPNNICVNQVATYSLSGSTCNLPSNFTWSTSNGFQIIYSNSTLVQVLATGTSSAPTVTATFQNGMKITKTVKIEGGSQTKIPITGYYINNYGQYANLINNYSGINRVQPNTNFDAVVSNPELATGTWSWIYGAYNSWSQVQLGGTNGNFLRLNLPQSNDVAVFRLTYNNTCGVAEYQDFLFFAQAPTSYAMSPNPTSNMLTVSINTQNSTNQKTLGTDGSDIREINIVDKTGIIRLKQLYNVGTKQLDMDLSALKPDIYIVRISDGKNWTNMKLVKQ